eukprot:TRINITY_DN80247_c0_g1_i1.p1 TRINITY_DN80247_c0_g1~~TRINITY_DN80247_c0_g1_i1.p1  ORF type:complete len:448 (-),score=100.20 TRINITY_DN80247_c0_g1_i1:435-1778(-)
MGCTQAKAAAPHPVAQDAVQEDYASGSETNMPTLLGRRRQQTGREVSDDSEGSKKTEPKGIKKAFTNAGQGIKKGAAGAVGAVGGGVTATLTAAQTAGSSAAGAVQKAGTGTITAARQVGSGAVGAVKAVGKGVTGVTGRLVGRGSEIEEEPSTPKELGWSDWLCSIDPWQRCCCPTHAQDDLEDSSFMGSMLGSLVKSVLSSFDASMLGVKVEVDGLHIDPATGRIEVHNLTVGNPEGYHSEYLLHADKIVVDLEMQKLLYSLGKEVDVEELICDGIDVIYEKGLRSSNLNDLLNNLAGPNEDASSSQDVTETQAQEDNFKLTMHQVLIKNIGAKVATKLTRGHGLRLEVGNLSYEDFDTEMGAGRGLMDVIRILLMTIIKSVLATVLGKQNIKALTGAADGAKKRARSGVQSTYHCTTGLCRSRPRTEPDSLVVEPSAAQASSVS